MTEIMWDEYKLIGIDFFNDKKYSNSIEFFNKYLSYHDDASVASKLSYALRVEGRTYESLEVLNKYIEIFPENIYLLTELCEYYFSSKKWDDAVKLYERLIAKHKLSAVDFNRYAIALNETGRNPLPIINKGLSLYPKDNELITKKYEYAKFNVAFIFYGHARSFKKTYENFKKNIVDINADDKVNIDVFIHTWSEIEHSIVKPHYKKDFNLAGKALKKEDIEFIENKYQPLFLKVDDQQEISEYDKNRIKSNGFDPKKYGIIYNISYSIKQSFSLLEISNRSYDLCLLTRLDINFLKPLRLLDTLDKKIKPFMGFDDNELENSVFYSFMESPDLVRNQNLYITGVDLLLMSKPGVMKKISNWNDHVLHDVPRGTESSITKIIKDNKFDKHLMYYSKPQSWSILRTNDNEFLDMDTDKFNLYKKLWKFDLVDKLYKESLKSNNSRLLEYMIYLMDTGQLDVCWGIILEYKISYFENYLNESKIDSDFKNNIKNIIKFFVEFFQNNSSDDVKGKIINYAGNGDLNSLVSLFNNNEGLFVIDDPKLQMVINYGFNKLMDSKELPFHFINKFIYLYSENSKINNKRRKYVLWKIVNYIESYSKIESTCFKSKSSDAINVIRLTSAIHRYGGNEEGAQEYIRRISSLVRMSSSLKIIKKEKTPKVAVCMSGLFRGNIQEASKNIINNIVEPLSADLFVHTWDHMDKWPGIAGDVNWVYRHFGANVLSKCPDELRNISFVEKNFPRVFNKIKNPERLNLDLNSIKEMLNPIEMLVDSEDNFFNKLDFDANLIMTRGHFNQAKMLYGIYEALSLMKKYELANNFKYDFIVRVRPDIGLSKISIEDLKKMDNNQIMVDFFSYGPQDQFRAGKRDVMTCMGDIWEYIIDSKNLSPFISFENEDSHNLTYLWMIYNGISPAPSVVKRDVSLAVRDVEIPDFEIELQEDILNINAVYKDRKDIHNFFHYLINRKI